MLYLLYLQLRNYGSIFYLQTKRKIDSYPRLPKETGRLFHFVTELDGEKINKFPHGSCKGVNKNCLPACSVPNKKFTIKKFSNPSFLIL